jgi:hypothetical protein
MISKNLSLPHKFYCITEDPIGIDSNINIIPIPTELKINGWWWKIYMFKENLFEHDINFYIDLDMIITSNIDHWMTYKPNAFLGLRDVSYVRQPNLYSLGSGVLRWDNNTHTEIYNDFLPKVKNIVSTYHSSGDQGYIQSKCKDIQYFPTEWYESYVWEYEKVGHKPTSNILVFHGRQKPHNTHHPIIKEYWK